MLGARWAIASLALISAAPMAAGCVEREVIVVHDPPSDRPEDPGAAPGTEYVYIRGHWAYDGRQYVWVRGRWVARRAGYLWVPGHWVRHGGGWLWVDGHWRRH